LGERVRVFLKEGCSDFIDPSRVHVVTPLKDINRDKYDAHFLRHSLSKPAVLKAR